MDTTLVIMAAGIGSRFGGGIKQLASVGPKGHIIMDYSIHDAIEAGFNHLVFIIRKDIEADFREVIGNRIEKICQQKGVSVNYTFQAIDDIPNGISYPGVRLKPWGTGQAVLTCKGIVNTPFAVINADDFYGKESFKKIHEFLKDYSPAFPNQLCMAGFILKNTLSDNGGVTRGICTTQNDHLVDVVETKHIVKTETGAEADGVTLDPNALVSMNMWGLTPEFIDYLHEGFVEFLTALTPEAVTNNKEYLLPTFIDSLLHRDLVSVKVLPTSGKWFGVTYAEDKDSVKNAIVKLIAEGIYREDLYADL